MGIAGMEKLAKLGIDLGGLENLAKPLSVDESALGIKKVVRTKQHSTEMANEKREV